MITRKTKSASERLREKVVKISFEPNTRKIDRRELHKLFEEAGKTYPDGSDSSKSDQ